MAETILRARGVTKRFGGVTALDGLDFELRRGEIHAICGENGAGKSTLIKVFSGIYPFGSFEGETEIMGQPARFAGIRDAEKVGIAVIYQELALVPDMTVAENLSLGVEPARLGVIDWDEVHERARAMAGRFGIDIDPGAMVRDLGVGRCQLVEIMKALRKESRILILDEPTAALTEQETAILLGILRDLSARGISIVYISHKLDEVFSIADRMTVIRDGRHVWTRDRASTNREEVVAAMVGREITDYFPRRAARRGEAVLEVRNLSVSATPRGRGVLHGISFNLHAGEVLGIGGLMGAGRTELLMHLFGAWGVRLGGEVLLDGRPLDARSPAACILRGMVLVSEDRKRLGLQLDQSVAFNITLSRLRELARAGIIDPELEFEESREYFHKLTVRGATLDTVVSGLSGGNQQKVVLARALMTRPRVVLLDEPTRGIDVGARVEIYEVINSMTDAGCAVLMVSSDLPELLGMSDRILMLGGGRIGGEFESGKASQESLMRAALGHLPSEAAS